MVNRFDFEEPTKANKSCCSCKRAVLIVCILFIVLVVVGGICAALYFFGIPFLRKLINGEDDANLSNVNLDKIEEGYTRVDCLPWYKNKTKIKSATIESECRQKSYCKYANEDNNRDIPSCFVERDKMRVSFEKIPGETDTDLSESYQVTYFDQSKRADVKLKLVFEYLDDFALRFTVKILLTN
jgi:hypothetical protein